MVGRLNMKIRHVLANLRKIPILFAGNTHFYLYNIQISFTMRKQLQF